MRANRGEVERMSLLVEAVDVMTTGRARPRATPSDASKRLMSRSFFAAGACSRIEFPAAMPIDINIPIRADMPSLTRSCGHDVHGIAPKAEVTGAMRRSSA